jgi:WD repeat and SOF domain-containing protein 1
MDRMFAKPFVDALGGHQDGVYCLGKDPRRVSVVAGGGGDGEVIVHSLTMRRPLLKIPNAHRGMVGGICWTAEARDGKRGLITAGKLDGTIKVWRSDAFTPGMRDKEAFDGNEFGNGAGSSSQAVLDQAGAIGEDGVEFEDEEGGGLSIDTARRDAMGKSLEPSMSYTSKNGFNGIDHHRTDGVFATASNTVQIWDETRSSPMSTLAFGSSMETVSGVKFNQSETSVLASIGNDRTMCLYDIRTGKAERRIMMQVGLFIVSNTADI